MVDKIRNKLAYSYSVTPHSNSRDGLRKEFDLKTNINFMMAKLTGLKRFARSPQESSLPKSSGKFDSIKNKVVKKHAR